MANGLVQRYQKAEIEHPIVIYTDRDCCEATGHRKISWPNLEVRSDVWHFTRILAVGCASESHPLYGTFMARLLDCVFIWDGRDFTRLKTSQKKQLQTAGVRIPTAVAILKSIT